MVPDKLSGALRDVDRAVAGVEQVIDGAKQAVDGSRKIYGAQLLFRGVLWVVVYLLSIWVLRDDSMLQVQSRFARVVIALLPTPFFVWWLWTWLKGVRHMDELRQRIELEALAFAFPTTLVFLAAIGMLDSAIALNPAEVSLRHMWLMMPMLYYIGFWNAQRRYA
jgi:hypothetical protein